MENPYQTPQTRLSSKMPASAFTKDSDELATRGSRLGAALIDGLIMMAFAIPLMFALGVWEYASKGQQAPWELQLLAAVINYAVFLAIHGLLLKKYGQTVGKKALGVRIATLDGDVPPLGKLLLLRYVAIGVISYAPVVGPFIAVINILFIFRKDKRCIHDIIAGTRVLKMNAGA